MPDAIPPDQPQIPRRLRHGVPCELIDSIEIADSELGAGFLQIIFRLKAPWELYAMELTNEGAQSLITALREHLPTALETADSTTMHAELANLTNDAR
jgi:hypothetical protein